MKWTAYLFGLILMGLAAGCEKESGGTLVKGQLAGSENLQIALDAMRIGQPAKEVGITAIDAEGQFKLGFVQGLEPGIYQLRVGRQSAIISIGEGESPIEITGSLQDLANYEFAVTGSPSTTELQTTLQTLRKGRLQVEDAQELIEGINSPQTAAFVAYSMIGNAGAAGLPIHKAVLERLPDDDPNKATYAQFTSRLEQQQQASLANERIQVGMPAPDIVMEDPDGKEYRLSDLKGQVVLLDFWASWCRPCRRENPNVVKVYDRYKDDGFTIYSVSLDGPDARRLARMTPDQVDKATSNSKQRWVQAIQQDNLTWPYHVSELRKWDSSAGRDYGVRGIPKTFLIDREGKIAAVGLRGAAAIEQALQRVI